MSDANENLEHELAAIRKVLAAYCRGVDRHDLELIKSAFHPDAKTDHGADFRGNAWEIWARLFEQPEATLASQHHMTNQLVDVTGSVAYAETYFVAYFVRSGVDGAPQLRSTGGRYVDRLEKRDAGWRIANRVSVVDWEQTEPYQPTGGGASRVRGRRDRLDISYTFTDQTDNRTT